jgi:20S proteasome subunit beta 4
MSLDEAKELLRKCIAELKMRLVVNFPSYIVKVIDKDGIREIDLTN